MHLSKYRAVLSLSAVVLLFAGAVPATAQIVLPANVPGIEKPRHAATTADVDSEAGSKRGHRPGGDFFETPQTNEHKALRKEALKHKLATGSKKKVHEVAKGQFVELELERNDRVFVILVEYGDEIGLHEALAETLPGPRHNKIAPPDRAVDNSTIWQPDYNKAHYEDMYFNKMVDYFRKQSSGRYTINGSVTEWVKVPFNGSRYGSNSMGDAAAWTLIADAINIWTADQLAARQAAGMNAAEARADLRAYLQTFDLWDRYDYNKNGNFDEPDGYIDHFQIVHAGIGEETDSQGTPDAIWSHRWQAFYNWKTYTGPSYNLDGGLQFGGGWGSNPDGYVAGSASASVNLAGTTVANVINAHPYTPLGIWVKDYTIQPENGGLGVFAHEYGHDLNLPDHYDTNGGSNGVGFWNIMASGSYLGDGTTDIGTSPGDMSAWDKYQLGWLNAERAYAGSRSVHRLGPAETTTKAAQAVIVELPPSTNVHYQLDALAVLNKSGSKFWWSGRSDNRDATMIREVTVPTTDPILRMKLSYVIESGWDYAYVSVSTNGGTTWTNLPSTNITTNSNPFGQNLGNGITGNANAVWRNASFDLKAYAGETVLLRIRYKTDEYTFYKGIGVDDISLGEFSDGAETGDNGWTLDGFTAATGTEISNNPHFYIAEFRQYRTYDRGLQTGPYTFGTLGSNAAGNPVVTDWVTHYPYQDGLLIGYWDFDEPNNNITMHRGEGEYLPIDAHPEPLTRTGLPFEEGTWNFSPWSATIQTYDATFGLQPTDAIEIPFVGTLPPAPGSPEDTPNRVGQFLVKHPSLPAVPVFNDLLSYWSPLRPENSVIVPKTGTTIKVISTSAHDGFMQVHVEPVK